MFKRFLPQLPLFVGLSAALFSVSTVVAQAQTPVMGAPMAGTVRAYTPAQNNAIAEKFFESAWNKGDFDSVASLLAPNVVDHSLVPGEVEGPEKFRAIVAMFRGAMPDVHMIIEDEIYAQDRVVHRWLVQGTHKGAPLFGVPASGKKLSLSGVTTVRMAGGQIQERWTQLDQLGLLQQLGVVPTPPSDDKPMKAQTPVSNKGAAMIPPESNNAIAEKFFETAWNKGDFNSVASLLSPYVVDHSTVPGQAEGPEKFKAIVGMFRAAMPDIQLTIEDEIYAKDKVVHRWMVKGTHTGAPLFGVPATGKTTTLTGVSIIRLVNGQFVERWTQLDLLGLMGQLGLVPPPVKQASVPMQPRPRVAVAPQSGTGENSQNQNQQTAVEVASKDAALTDGAQADKVAASPTASGEPAASSANEAGQGSPEADPRLKPNGVSTGVTGVSPQAEAASPVEPSHALNLMVIKSLKAPVGRPKAPDSDFWNRDFLTGNWGGARDRLHDKGLDLALAYFSEYFDNVSGGLREDGATQQVGILSVDLYSTRQGFLRGGVGQQIHLTTAYLGGASLARTRVGSLNPIVYSDAADSYRLFELWYGRKFDNNKGEVRIGKILPYVQFGAARSSGLLENGSFNYPTFLGFGVGSSYLAAPFGVQLRLTPKQRLTFMGQVQVGYDDPSGGLANRTGLKIFTSPRQGIEGTLELAYRTNQLKGDGGLPGTFRLGGQFHTGRFADKFLDSNGNSRALSGGDPKTSYGNYGVYATIEQMVTREGVTPEARRQGLTAFVRGLVVPNDINTISSSVAAGFSYEGLLPRRDKDVAAFGLSRTQLSRGVRRFQRDLQTIDPAARVPTAETVAELQYNVQLAPWWIIKLDAQQIINPSGSHAIPDSTVLGISTRFSF